ncbi:MAG: oligosaccharide flippase family protein [Lachnospiraceae bacterium]|nr:oligosaccharide flippase family protein [Lachnospiraceae bacterium]
MKIRKNSQREFKGNMTAYAVIIAYIICLVLRIPLCRFIGDEGVGLYAMAFEIFILITLLFSHGVSRTITGMIRYRVKRAQYKSARKVFNVALRLSFVASAVFAVVAAAASGLIADTLVLEPMSKKAVLAVSPVIILAALVNVFRGYFNGNGYGVLGAHSQYIEKIAMVIFSVIGGRLMYDYGLKVSALLKNDMAAYAYGALGAVMGMILAELITLIYLLVIFIIYSGTWKKQLAQDSARRVEGDGEISGLILGSAFPTAVIAVICNSFMLIDQRFFNYCMNRMELGAQRAGVWGAYYGKFAVLTGISAALVCLALCGFIGKIGSAYDKEEYRMMKDRMGSAVKTLCVIAIPIAVFMAVMAQALVNGLYKGENELAISMVRRGSVIIFLYGAAYLFGQLMLKVHMAKEFLISLVISYVLHIGALFLMERVLLLGAAGVLYSTLVFIGLLAVLCFVFTVKRLKYRQELIYSVLLPVLAACIVGLIVMLINKLLLPAVGNLPTVLITLVIGFVLYILLLMALRVLNEGELSVLPFGNFWIKIGRAVGLM